MLFNSHLFIFVFLPLTLIGFAFCRRRYSVDVSITWLVLCSLVFYGWWYPPYLALLIASVAFNYSIGKALIRLGESGEEAGRRSAKLLLAGGVTANLLAIGYFKYAGFVSDNVSALFGASPGTISIVLPLAISFFTFQQIAYLIDCERSAAVSSGIQRYFLFVTFFPQLIAGPIVLFRDVMPQINVLGSRLSIASTAIPALTFFSIGLFKKVVIADHLAVYSDLAFATANSTAITFSLLESWAAALTYSLQLYFDFSGYSDMALGLALMFGIRLPFNFGSPYKASSIIEFWRRWHITLSRFLREYLYFPLGGNRKGTSRRHVNIMIVMLLGGLWHGAGWTFVIWGGVHGVLLVVNHLWRMWKQTNHSGRPTPRSAVLWRGLCVLMTFMAVSAAWVVFRAESTDAALRIYTGLIGFNGIVLPPQVGHLFGGPQNLDWLSFVSVAPTPLLKFEAVAWIFILLPVVWLMPNSQQIVSALESKREKFPHGRFVAPAIGVMAGIAFGVAVAGLGGSVQFLYFQF